MKKKESETTLDSEKPFDFDTFEIKTIEDIYLWNLHAHRAFREAKKHNPKCDPPFPCKCPTEDFHPKAKIKFQRFDQPENVLKVKRRSKEIEWEGQLKPGCTYELPLPIIRYLNNLATPIFAEVKVDDGGETKTETKQVGERNRFSCHLVEMT